jgi:predicted N-formylglutamate amidohydrolase
MAKATNRSNNTAAMPSKKRLVVSCEHGGNRVPARYQDLFRGQREILDSHRGYDWGTPQMARALARRFDAPLVASTTTRLLVELNRSLGHPQLFSPFTSQLDAASRQHILDNFYFPYRQRVESLIADRIGRSQFAVHISVHSFTPVLDGQVRRADVGLLYDPKRDAERRLCAAWKEALLRLRNDLRVRRNYPYLGKSDGFTPYLRKRFMDQQYAGIELEVNQKWTVCGRADWQRLQADIVQALVAAFQATEV